MSAQNFVPIKVYLDEANVDGTSEPVLFVNARAPAHMLTSAALGRLGMIERHILGWACADGSAASDTTAQELGEILLPMAQEALAIMQAAHDAVHGAYRAARDAADPAEEAAT